MQHDEGKPYNGWQRIMAISAYVDDSGSDPSAPLYVLGGVCLPEGWWKHVAEGWAGVLAAHPAVEYFKASEVWEKDPSKGTPFAELTTRQREWKVDCLVEALCDFHPAMFSFQMEWRAFKDFKATHALPEDRSAPYFYLYYGLI